jgi:uncharacterized membrane protein YkoI
MTRKFLFLVAMIALASTAQASDQIRLAQSDAISREQAIEIAKNNGLVTLRDVDREVGRWEIEGRDENGRRIEIYVGSRSGEILKVERGR